jgi:hypothetical protein
MGHLPVSKLLFECGMDKYETRRLNLRALLHSHCGGRAATLADLIGRSPSYVSRMLYPEGKDGKKRIGEDMRDLIEEALSLKRGTLDEEPSALTEQGDIPADRQPHAVRAATPMQAQPQVAALQEATTLERLDTSEKSLLELYRRATDEGKVAINRAAMAVPKTDD